MTKYENGYYLIMVPVYYDFETLPAWRKYYKGTKKECENIFTSVPDFLRATPEENRRNRENARLEYLLLMNHGKTAHALKIKEKYQL